MQRMILPDYLDGTRVPKNKKLDTLISLAGMWKYIEPIDHKGWKLDFQRMDDDNFSIFNGIPNEETFDLLKHDQSLNNLLRAYSDYMKSDKRNYLISKNLTEAFKNTSSKISTKYLPKNFQAYIEIPGLLDQDGWRIEGFFVSICEYKDCWKFYAGYLSENPEEKNLDASFINIELSDSDTVEECVKKMPYVRQWIDKETRQYKTETSPSQYNPYLHALFNSIIYICHAEDIKENKNTFATKRSKRVAQQKIYTPKTFELVGYNMKLPRTYTVDSTIVSGHFRWQPHGPGRSLLKHIYIEPHPRNYK
jgi:hypothetical protein